MEVYLDNNATTFCLPEVIAAVTNVLIGKCGNPSSAHSSGDAARRQIHDARMSVAHLIGSDPDQLTFTSCGTESNYIAIQSAITKSPRNRHIVTTTIEHSSVLKHCERLEQSGYEFTYVKPNRCGQIEVQDIVAAIKPNTALVSLQWVNNETGVIQPVEEVASICRSQNVLFHTDAAQAIGKLFINPVPHGIDFLTFTGHKFHAPAGVGVLWSADTSNITSSLIGGDQEYGRRAGTENIIGIVGLGVAAKSRLMRFREINNYICELRDTFEHGVIHLLPDVEINGTANRVSNTSNLLFHGIDGQALIARLDQLGVYCSQSSACTNRRPEPSYVLRAMGLSEASAYSSIRFSFSLLNTLNDVEIAVSAIVDLVNRLRKFLKYTQNSYSTIEG